MMQIKQRAQRIRKKWGKEGFWSWAQRNFLVEVWPFVYDKRTLVWLQKDLVDEIEPAQAEIPVQIKVVDDPGDELVPVIRKAAEIASGYSSFVKERLQEGAKCYLAVDRNGILACQWVTSG